MLVYMTVIKVGSMYRTRGDGGRIWNKELKKSWVCVIHKILHNISLIFEQGFILSESNDFIDIEIYDL